MRRARAPRGPRRCPSRGPGRRVRPRSYASSRRRPLHMSPDARKMDSSVSVVVGLGEVGRPLLKVLERVHRVEGVDLPARDVAGPPGLPPPCPPAGNAPPLRPPSRARQRSPPPPPAPLPPPP